MTLMRWDPFRELINFQQSVCAADESFGAWVPSVDVFEKGDDLIIRAELPGVRREEIAIDINDGTLTLQGERQRDQEMEEGKTYRVERSFGRFTRRFALPKTVDASKISAQYKDGVLEVRLPKMEEAKPRKIQIQAA